MRLLRGSLALLLSFSLSQPADAFFGWGAKSAAPAPIGAVIVELAGKVEFQSKDAKGWQPAQLQQPLENGDSIVTDARGFAVILFTDGSKVRLSKNAVFVMEQQNGREVKLAVKFGYFQAWVKQLRSRRWKVRTPSAVAAVRGTEFVINLKSPDGSVQSFENLQQLIDSNIPIAVNTTFELYTGSIDVSDGFGNQTQMSPGQQLNADATKGIAQSKPQPLPAGKKMAPKPSAKDAAKRAAADAEKRAKTAKKKAEDAEKKAKEAEKKGDKAAAEKAKMEAEAAKKDAAKAELVQQVAAEIIKMEERSEAPAPPPPGPEPGPLPPAEGTPEEGALKPQPNPVQDESIETVEGIQTDVSPSSP